MSAALDAALLLVPRFLLSTAALPLRSWFRRRARPAPAEVVKLGPHSPLVLAKLGYDMRQEYNGLVEEPLPEAIRKVAEKLPDQPVLRLAGEPPEDRSG